MNQQQDTLRQRLNRLERENRWWKVAGIVALAALGFIVLTGATDGKFADEIRTSNLVLVDKGGKVRGEIAVRGDGSAEMVLKGKDGSAHIGLVVLSDDSSGVVILDKDEIPRAIMAMELDERPSFALFNKDGKVIWSAP